MEGIKEVMNAAVAGQGSASKRIAGDAGREYVLHRDAPIPLDRKKSSGGLQQRTSETGGSGGFGSGGSGPLGKPPLAPRRNSSQVYFRQASLPKPRIFMRWMSVTTSKRLEKHLPTH